MTEDRVTLIEEHPLLYFPRLRLFRRPQNATPRERAALLAGVVEMFRLPVEDELCASAEAAAAEQDAAGGSHAAPAIERQPV